MSSDAPVLGKNAVPKSNLRAVPIQSASAVQRFADTERMSADVNSGHP
jgi:hypothetical protein